jgi:hypothetical protein
MMAHFGSHALKAQCQPETLNQSHAKTQAGTLKLLPHHHLLEKELNPTMGPDSPTSASTRQVFDEFAGANFLGCMESLWNPF